MKVINSVGRFKPSVNHNKNLLLMVGLMAIIVIVLYWKWFSLDSIFFYGDAMFRFDEYARTFFTTYNTWLSENGMGGANIQIYFFLTRAFWALLLQLGFSSTAALKLTHFLPIAIFSLISPFVFLRKLTKNNAISLVGAIFYGTTTYLLATIARGHLPIAFIYVLAPLIFFFFIVALEKNRFIHWLNFSLIYWVGICYEVRIMYVLSLILLLYFLYFRIFDFKKYLSNIFLSFILLLTLNAFWLLPVLLGGLVNNINEVATRAIFGNWLFGITQSFTVFHFSWTGAKPGGLVLQQIPWHLWVTPVSLFTLSVFLKIKRYKKYVIFFWIISLIGIFLCKQDSFPLSGSFSWIRDNLPTFTLFRNASKLFIVTAIGYTGLIGYLLLSLRENKSKIYSKYLFIGFFVIILLASLWNTKPLITGEIETMFVPRYIPNDYLVLKDFILKQPEFFRTFWVPADSRWGIFTSEKPIIGSGTAIGIDWKNYASSDYKDWPNKIKALFEMGNTDKLFDETTIKYVIVPIDDFANDADPFYSYGRTDNPNIRQWYIDELDKVEFLKKIDIGTKELVVYENENYRPHIYTTREKESIYSVVPFENVEYSQKNPTEYAIHIKNISHPFYLNFSESFHPDWKVRVGDFGWFSVLTQKNYFLSNDLHSKNQAGLNYFYINPEDVCASNSCIKNADGSYDIDLTLYFKPQSYFYLGLIISGLTLLGCLGYLGYALLKRRKKRNVQSYPQPLE